MSQGHPAIDVFLRSSQPGLRVWYSDTICRHTSAENAERQLRIASECGVQLVQDIAARAHEYAKYGDWLRGKETRLSVRSEFRRAG